MEFRTPGWQPSGSGLIVPEDKTAKARAKIINALKESAQLMTDAGFTSDTTSPEVLAAFGVEVLRLVYHEGLAD
jgi:hypothetical protein